MKTMKIAGITTVLLIGVMGIAYMVYDKVSHPPTHKKAEDKHDHPKTGGHADHGAPDAHAEEGHDDHVESSDILMSDEKIQQADIRTISMATGKVMHRMTLQGKVEYNQDKWARLQSPVAGMLVSMQVKQGDHVKQGQVLAVVKNMEFSGQKQAIALAKKRVAYAEEAFQREKRLWEAQISAKKDYLAAELAWQEAKAELDKQQQMLNAQILFDAEGNAAIKAPFAGVILHKLAVAGQMVFSDTPLLELADTGQLWVQATIYPKDLSRVQVGQAAYIYQSGAEAKVQTTIATIAPEVDGRTGLMGIRLPLLNQGATWVVGMPVLVDIEKEANQTAIKVPKDAVQYMGEQAVVFVRTASGFRMQKVRLGDEGLNDWSIAEGLSADAVVATHNSFLVKAEMEKASAEHTH